MLIFEYSTVNVAMSNARVDLRARFGLFVFDRVTC